MLLITGWLKLVLQRVRVEKMEFRKPFQSEGYDKKIPAGTCVIKINEELIQGLSFSAYRRVSTTLLVPEPSGQLRGTRFFSVVRADLDDAQRIG